MQINENSFITLFQSGLLFHKIKNKTCWQGCRGRGHLNILLVGMQIGTNSLMMHQKTKNKPTI